MTGVNVSAAVVAVSRREFERDVKQCATTSQVLIRMPVVAKGFPTRLHCSCCGAPPIELMGEILYHLTMQFHLQSSV